jgi:hypothetical protein
MAALWFVPAAMLLLALAQLPYGYYTLLRLVVCLSAAIIAYVSWTKHTAWAVVFAIIALLFNPLIIVALNRETWAPIDVGVAVLYGAHGWMMGRHRGRSDDV